jgi:hypothetical protein
MDTKASPPAKRYPCGAEHLAKIQDLMSSEQNTGFDRSRKITAPQVVWMDATSKIHIKDSLDIIKRSTAAVEARIRSICIVENISPDLTDSLCTAWELDATFFYEYATNPEKAELWRSKKDAPAIYQEVKRYSHLDGIFEYHGIETSPQETLNSYPNIVSRRCFKDSAWPIQSNSRISYYRVNPWLCKSNWP